MGHIRQALLWGQRSPIHKECRHIAVTASIHQLHQCPVPDIPLEQVEAVQNEVIVLLENNGRMPAPAADGEQPEAPNAS